MSEAEVVGEKFIWRSAAVHADNYTLQYLWNAGNARRGHEKERQENKTTKTEKLEQQELS